MSRKLMIDWLVNPDGTPGKTHNIVKGCNGPDGDGEHCSYCYAKQMVGRYNYVDMIAKKEVEYHKKIGMHTQEFQSEILYKKLLSMWRILNLHVFIMYLNRS